MRGHLAQDARTAAGVPGERFFRSIFLSDVHLGSPWARTGPLLDFLRRTDAEHLYLVGDIVDGWRLKRRWYWPRSHGEVLAAIRAKARSGVRVTYVPGNHDEAFRELIGRERGGIRYDDEVEHVLADGRRFVVLHGDRFDRMLARRGWTMEVGSRSWGVARRFLRRSGSDRLAMKQRLKRLLGYLGRFERSVASFAQQRRLDGVVCGHVHKPELREVEGVAYCNDGDWVQSCTALVEHLDGTLELLGWTQNEDPAVWGAG